LRTRVGTACRLPTPRESCTHTPWARLSIQPQPSSLFSFLSLSRACPIRSFSTSNINHDTFKSVGSPVPRWRRKPQEDRTMKSIIRKDEAAVSPVIATILMVAITVVLAAVLYVMVSGLLTPTGQGPRVMGVNIGRSGDGTNWTLLD